MRDAPSRTRLRLSYDSLTGAAAPIFANFSQLSRIKFISFANSWVKLNGRRVGRYWSRYLLRLVLRFNLRTVINGMESAGMPLRSLCGYCLLSSERIIE